MGLAPPSITGVESDSRHMPVLLDKYKKNRAVRVEHADFLADGHRKFDFVVGNPPYVAITSLSESEKAEYRARYATARGRFDLYLLFFEKALSSLAPGGRLVFITPEKYLYVETAGPLRNLLSHFHVEAIRFVREDTFGKLVTYPTVTVMNNAMPGPTQIVRRDNTTTTVSLPLGKDSWLPLLEGESSPNGAITLSDVCLRISCGVATGADDVFVQPMDGLDPTIRRFSYPTLAGRELTPTTVDLKNRFVMLIPYDTNCRLLPMEKLGSLGRYLMRGDIRRRLLARRCVRRKPWHAFHETPMLRDILRPKILCKDICEKPHFWVDRSGRIVPRHSIYYIVPHEPDAVDAIAGYLQSPAAQEWLTRNCQHAAKGFLRLQSRALQRLPLPDDVALAIAGKGIMRRVRSHAQQAEPSFM